MSLLNQLLQDDAPAIAAISAIPEPESTRQSLANSTNSKNSNGPDGKSEAYARLLALADFECLPAELVHRLTAADLADVADETDTALTGYLYALADTADREAGRVPPGHTGAILCAHCGPVWVSLDVARVLPVVNGWPRAVGCPWCLIAKRPIPRPPIRCCDCKQFIRDRINPPAGMGHCGAEQSANYPGQVHECPEFQPEIAED